ncbi:RlpA-like double-psi beta-barrel-protein domain-containing protein-containing protein, partial [Blyttiomyces helicus]
MHSTLTAATSTALVALLLVAPSVSADSTGDMTYYTPGLGACGQTNSESDYIVAMNQAQYDGTCGNQVCITYNGGSGVTATVMDECPGCSFGDLDVSPVIFNALCGSLDAGRVTISWTW